MRFTSQKFASCLLLAMTLCIFSCSKDDSVVPEETDITTPVVPPVDKTNNTSPVTDGPTAPTTPTRPVVPVSTPQHTDDDSN